jgi:hypothetical protein
VRVFTSFVRTVNHSCLPNADHAIDWSNLRMTVYASAPIAAGAEICIEYVPLLAAPRSSRQALLREHFGFDCACAACSRSPDEVAASDGRRGQLSQLVERVAMAGVIGTPEGRRAAVDGLERIRDLLECVALALV